MHDSQRKAGVRHKSHVCTNTSCRVNHPYQLREQGNTHEIQTAGRMWTLQAGLADSNSGLLWQLFCTPSVTYLVTDHNLVPGPIWTPLTSQVVILFILWNRDESAPILLTSFLGSHSWATCVSLDLPGSWHIDQEGISYGTDLPGATLVRKNSGGAGVGGRQPGPDAGK